MRKFQILHPAILGHPLKCPGNQPSLSLSLFPPRAIFPSRCASRRPPAATPATVESAGRASIKTFVEGGAAVALRVVQRRMAARTAVAFRWTRKTTVRPSDGRSVVHLMREMEKGKDFSLSIGARRGRSRRVSKIPRLTVPDFDARLFTRFTVVLFQDNEAGVVQIAGRTANQAQHRKIRDCLPLSFFQQFLIRFWKNTPRTNESYLSQCKE